MAAKPIDRYAQEIDKALYGINTMRPERGASPAALAIAHAIQAAARGYHRVNWDAALGVFREANGSQTD